VNLIKNTIIKPFSRAVGPVKCNRLRLRQRLRKMLSLRLKLRLRLRKISL